MYQPQQRLGAEQKITFEIKNDYIYEAIAKIKVVQHTGSSHHVGWAIKRCRPLEN